MNVHVGTDFARFYKVLSIILVAIHVKVQILDATIKEREKKIKKAQKFYAHNLTDLHRDELLEFSSEFQVELSIQGAPEAANVVE